MSDEKVNVFEFFDNPDKFLAERGKREYEMVKAHVRIGDDYSSIKAQLDNPKHYIHPLLKGMCCTSYTDYELSPPQTMPDGSFYVDCAFVEVDCLGGPDDPQLFCRLYFDSEQKLTSIDRLGEE